MTTLFRIFALWRAQAGWLVAGVAISLVAFGAAVALMMLSGSLLVASFGGLVVALPAVLRVVGPVRVVSRYLERLTTHEATFRALTDLRVWFYRGLAASRGGSGGSRPRLGASAGAAIAATATETAVRSHASCLSSSRERRGKQTLGRSGDRHS